MHVQSWSSLVSYSNPNLPIIRNSSLSPTSNVGKSCLLEHQNIFRHHYLLTTSTSVVNSIISSLDFLCGSSGFYACLPNYRLPKCQSQWACYNVNQFKSLLLSRPSTVPSPDLTQNNKVPRPAPGHDLPQGSPLISPLPLAPSVLHWPYFSHNALLDFLSASGPLHFLLLLSGIIYSRE